MKLEFKYKNLAGDNPDLTDPWSIYLDIGADFSVYVSGVEIYGEVLFPVVEFVTHGLEWLSTSKSMLRDFIYTSMESDEPGLVWIKQQGAKWKVGSVHQERQAEHLVDFFEVELAFEQLSNNLKLDLRKYFNVDLDAVFGWFKNDKERHERRSDIDL